MSIDNKNLSPRMLRAMHRAPALRQPTKPDQTAGWCEVIRPTTKSDEKPSLSDANWFRNSESSTKAESGALFTIPGQPIGKPRQTQSDKWKKRPCVVRYRAWADKARAVGATLIPDFPHSIKIVAYLEIPKSVSRVKRMAMTGTMHRLRGDADNFLKAAMDALFEQDGCLAIVHAEKYWDDGDGPRMEVTIL